MKKFQLITAILALTVMGGAASPALAKSCHMKTSQVNQLHTGMTYPEVVALVGCEGDHSMHMGAIDIYEWGEASSLTFQGGKLQGWVNLSIFNNE